MLTKRMGIGDNILRRSQARSKGTIEKWCRGRKRLSRLWTSP